MDFRNTLDEMFRRNKEGFPENGMSVQKVFISSTSGKARAVTHCGVSKTLDDAYRKAKKAIVREILDSKAIPQWICMGFVDTETAMTLEEFYNELADTEKYYYRRGVALDPNYRTFFLEQELNGASLIKYDKLLKTPELHHQNIRLFLKNKKTAAPKTVFPDMEKVESVISFQCSSCFFDGEHHTLHDRGPETGMRTVETFDADLLRSLVDRSADYLKSTVKDDGSFVYGYFPPFGKVVPGYNTIRHCLSVMALLDVYKLTGDEKWRDVAQRTYRYYMETFFVEAGDQRACIVDWANHEEVRLGALGLSIIMILSYATVFHTDEDIPRAVRLGNFILDMQNSETGQFTHVLQYPDLQMKDMFRIIYYSGEATYGLIRLFDVTRDERYLNAVRKAFDFFIENAYETYSDHWLSYASNELTRHVPDDRYYAFGLRNAFIKIKYMFYRQTTWPTFLELLNAAFIMVRRIREQGKEHLLEGYDVGMLYRTLAVRAVRQRNGIFYPEKAMFFEHPGEILNGVYIRHCFFRSRNDDIAHHLLGYVRLLAEILPIKPDLLDLASSPEALEAGSREQGKILRKEFTAPRMPDKEPRRRIRTLPSNLVPRFREGNELQKNLERTLAALMRSPPP